MMAVYIMVVCLSAITHHTIAAITPSDQGNQDIENLKQMTAESGNQLKLLIQTLEGLTRQMMLQQLFVEERIRTDGDSGLKQLRVQGLGTRNYFSESYSGLSVGALHDHPEHDRTVGMGEVNMVMNGVEFRTRHNDYKLVMPHKTSKVFGATENIRFPPVPPSVYSKAQVSDQIQEMREYFKAFRDQNTTHRDYHRYFKPVLCYMEGYWTTDTDFREPFESDTYTVDASSWDDLLEKARYSAFTGSDNLKQDFAFLPRTIMNVNNGTPEFAQWNYDILCHEIQREFNRDHIRVLDDIAARLPYKMTLEEFSQTPAARFDFPVHPRRYNGTLGYSVEGYGEGEWSYEYDILDHLMLEIPGKDNYQGYIEDHSFGLSVCNIMFRNYTTLNTGRYHRIYKVTEKGAMGTVTINRGFNDRHFWAAKTTQPNIAEIKVSDCRNKNCRIYSAKYTYAIPLEIIWLSPLYNWNPYHVEYHNKITEATVTANNRNGGMTLSKAFNGISSHNFYRTPTEFFTTNTTTSVGVIDTHGFVRRVSPSGTRMFLPDIPGVGKLRMRYPLMPTHGEGSAVEKEFDAFKDIIMNMTKYAKYFDNDPNPGDNYGDHDIHFVTTTTHKAWITPHYHDIYLTPKEMGALYHHKPIFTYSGHTKGPEPNKLDFHQHAMVIEFVDGIFRIKHCDVQDFCKDGHANTLIRIRHRK